MNRLDAGILILSILAIVSFVVILFLPGIPDQFQLLPVFVLLVCSVYFLTVRRRSDSRQAEPTQVASFTEASPDLADADQTAYDYYARRYGVGYEHLEIDWTIREDGSATVLRIVHLRAHSDLAQLETALVIPDEPPSEESWEIERLKARSLTPRKRVVPDTPVGADGKLSTLLRIMPQLRADDELTYEMEEMLPSGLYAMGLGPKELEERLKKDRYDYAGWNINRPTRKLSLSVFFPSSFVPNYYRLEVRYAAVAPGMSSTTLQRDERNRLSEPTLHGSDGSLNVLKLEVDYPMIGLVYLVFWVPVERSDPGAEAASEPDSTSGLDAATDSDLESTREPESVAESNQGTEADTEPGAVSGLE